MERGKLLLRIEQPIQDRIGIAHAWLALRLQKLVHQSHVARPDRRTRAGTTDTEPSGGGTARVGHGAVHGIACGGIAIGGHIGNLTESVSILVLHTWTGLPTLHFKRIADTATAARAFGA